MRTLFLLTTLATLLVIVTKMPEQTFWEAAQGLWGKVETTASEVAKAPPVPSFTGNAKEDFAALQKWVRAVDGESPAAGSKDGTDRDGSANTVPSFPAMSPKTKPKPDTVRNAEILASSSGDVKVIPRSKVTDIPELPAIPVEPVEVGRIEESPLPPSRSRPRPADSPGFGEVKSHYENASRLLAEIK